MNNIDNTRNKNWDKCFANYFASLSNDKEFMSNLDRLYDVKLLEEMKSFKWDYEDLFRINKWNHYGSGKVRGFKRGVKHIKN